MLGARRSVHQTGVLCAAGRLLARAWRRADSVIEVAAWRWVAVEWDRGFCSRRRLAWHRPTPHSVEPERVARGSTLGTQNMRALRRLFDGSLAHGVAPSDDET